jgi:adenylosuccinate synthase
VAKNWLKAAISLQEYLADTVEIINEHLQNGQKVLAEGAQAYWLDINHGMYPSVTSSSTTVSGLLDGLGVAPKHLGKVTGVAKAVKSHVGGGPLVTEITDEALADRVRGTFGAADSEYGATTQRARRIGYPDLVELRNAVRVNGVDELAISKLDHVQRYGDTVLVATSYAYQGEQRLNAPSSATALAECIPNYQEFKTWQMDVSGIREYGQLPAEAIGFIEVFQTGLGVPVKKIGVGPERNQVIQK